MNATEKYSTNRLKNELAEIEGSQRNQYLTMLNIYEKALIYKYSNYGYEAINERLRLSNGEEIDEFGKLLMKALNKLPNLIQLVYRGANLTTTEIDRYVDALEKNTLLKEHSFISATKSRFIAMAFGNVFFRIFSKTGKDVEKVTKFGLYGTSNEQEVLFIPNRKFRILEVKKELGNTTITMEEA